MLEHRRVCADDRVDRYVKELETRLLSQPGQQHIMIQKTRQLSVQQRNDELHIVDIGDLNGFSDFLVGNLHSGIQSKNEMAGEAE